MKQQLLFILGLFILSTNIAKQEPICTKEEMDLEYFFSGSLKEDMFYAKNYSLLNNCVDYDSVWFTRHVFDFNLNLVQGMKNYGHPLTEFMFSVRNKAIWGNPSTIAQMSESTIKIGDLVTGKHSHYFPRHVFWMREGWLRLSIPDALHLSTEHPHTFMLGAFPFELGRGIALGSAYAVAQDFLGFYTDGLVDQYAMGFKATGEFIPNQFYYDLYGAILENMSALLSDTGAEIRGQEYGYRKKPQRGFGNVHFLVATRFRWMPLPEASRKKIIIEPYVLYVEDPEQDIEFLADASSKLCTFGMAFDYVSDRIEFGFETAFNIGRQMVRGWDRNTVNLQNRNGQFTYVNSHVLIGLDPNTTPLPSNIDLYKYPYAPNVVTPTGVISSVGKTAQEEIELLAPQAEAFNKAPLGEVIPGLHDALPYVPDAFGSANPDQLYNARNRFRDPYKNDYHGWMFVADLAWWSLDKDLRLAFEVGVASGDDNPNFSTRDGDYSGFISIQEVYAGRKVRSQFVLGGAGKTKRPLSAPDEEDLIQSPKEFAQVVNGFTNLVYAGTGVQWVPLSLCKKFSFNPNILVFAQEHPVRKFDARIQKPTDEKASRFLGVEANLFTHYYLFENLRAFFIGSVFFPGTFYTDIKGLPINPTQRKLLAQYNKDGYKLKGEDIPNQGDDTAFTLNFGLEYKF